MVPFEKMRNPYYFSHDASTRFHQPIENGGFTDFQGYFNRLAGKLPGHKVVE